jgi:hypothetical protein
MSATTTTTRARSRDGKVVGPEGFMSGRGKRAKNESMSRPQKKGGGQMEAENGTAARF